MGGSDHRAKTTGSTTHLEHSGDHQDLKAYTIDLVNLAEQGKLDPVIGRDQEIRRAIEVLQRRTKNNPVLLGHQV